MRRIKGEGPRSATSFWIGLGPGVDEISQKRVWVGQGGRLLNSLLWKEDIDRRDIYITNLRGTMIRPGDGGPYAESEDVEIELMQQEPSLVVPMGREATQYFLGDVDMEAVHGIAWRAPLDRWSELSSSPAPAILPIYNPAYALKDAEAFMYVAWDLRQVKRAMLGELKVRQIRDEYPHPKYTIGFVPYPNKDVYVDTEGFPDAPFCVTYCCEPGRAHMILATDKEGLKEFRAWLAGRRKVYFHSAMWDLAVMRAMGLTVRDDQLGDTKVMVYVAGQIEPPGLKALGFRHACMRMQDYTDLTGPYDWVQAFEYLEKVAAVDWGKPDPVLERKDGKLHVKQPQGLNQRVNAIFTSIAKDEMEKDDGEMPKPVDPRKRWFKIEQELRQPAEDLLGPMPVFHLGLLPLEDVKRYACADADATCRIKPALWDVVTSEDHADVYETDIGALPIVERMQANGMHVRPGYFEKLAGYFQKEMDKIRKQIESYNGGKYVNPNSPPQTAALLFDRLRLPILKTTSGGKSGIRKPSTADKVLEALRGRHDAVGLICDWRELATLKDKFCNQLPQFVQADGRARGTIRDTTVVSGRYSMTNPNLMAIPTRTQTGKKIREGFDAQPGYELGTADFDQIEMRVMADESGDASMIKTFNDGRDIHSETAAMMFGVPLSAVETHEGKLLYRYPAKRIGFGIITGITGMGLYDQLRLAGIHKYSVSDCDQMIQDYFKARPGVPRYLNRCRNEAQTHGYVRDRGGRIRYLPGVYSSNQSIKEEALRQSHSHKISGTAQWLKKRALKRIWQAIQPLPRGEVEPLLEIHDEVIMEFKIERREWVGKMMTDCMSADTKLFKVPIKSKFTSGPNWGVLKD